MQWTDIKITVPKAQAEDAEAIATGVSGGGIYIEDYSDLEEQVERIAHVDLIEQDLLDKDRTHVTVHLYLSPDENPAEVLDLLIQYLRYVSRVSSRTLMTFSLIFSIWFPMRAANALLLSVRKAYGMGRPTQFLRHQAKVFLYTICLILTILLSLVLVTVGRSVLNLCADYFHFSAILTDGFIELWSTLRFVFLGCIVFLALAVLYLSLIHI